MIMWEWLAFAATCYVLLSSLILTVWMCFKFILCQHFWELVDKTELPPAMEALTKSGATSCYLWPSQIKEMCERTVVLALRCSKCGKSKIREISG
jgi:hypothetical protein